MKKVLLLIIFLFTHSAFAQEAKTSAFHRLLIFNMKNELMIVRVKNSDRWVTPGWYQDDRLTIKEGLSELVASYGIKTTAPTLRGVFTLKANQISTRLIYSAKLDGGEIKAPDIIEEIRWLPVEKALDVITFPHIRTQIRQITEHPGTIWGGSQTMYQENGAYGSKIIENFYPLSSAAE